jgi:hypothetical protein
MSEILPPTKPQQTTETQLTPEELREQQKKHNQELLKDFEAWFDVLEEKNGKSIREILAEQIKHSPDQNQSLK